MQIFHKAYVYLTCGTELLVFEQPEEPGTGLQVPGGTLDPGESFLQGAIREFIEETGLSLDIALEILADQDLVLDDEAGFASGLHRRRHYHGRIGAKPAEEWQHYEMTPSNGGPPILFRLFWLDLETNKDALETRLVAGFDAPLDALIQRF